MFKRVLLSPQLKTATKTFNDDNLLDTFSFSPQYVPKGNRTTDFHNVFNTVTNIIQYLTEITMNLSLYNTHDMSLTLLCLLVIYTIMDE